MGGGGEVDEEGRHEDRMPRINDNISRKHTEVAAKSSTPRHSGTIFTKPEGVDSPSLAWRHPGVSVAQQEARASRSDGLQTSAGDERGMDGQPSIAW